MMYFKYICHWKAKYYLRSWKIISIQIILISLFNLSLCWGIGGPGIPKVTFSQAELGTVIYDFPESYSANGGDSRIEKGTMLNGYWIHGGKDSEFIWTWDLGDPYKPKLISKFAVTKNTHSIPIFNNNILCL